MTCAPEQINYKFSDKSREQQSLLKKCPSGLNIFAEKNPKRTHAFVQWRRQDLLRGGAKIEIMSWDTHGGLRGRVQQLLDD